MHIQELFFEETVWVKLDFHEEKLVVMVLAFKDMK